ncbi:hypothetical protein SLEP1_g8060 [Rubroshorea leprosula]|uniref:Uncharacterized protein n=1 Tax=Rubroshorea leprosula TaxID=152421 RepID=A0AAV5I8E3_9ROSI|nr:hypothetical protein SLEP1_g8060 [Rubroshorea leprosula]
MTSHESSQKVSLMNAAVCTTRYARPPQSSRRTRVSAFSSIADFCFSSCSSSFLLGSLGLVAPGKGIRPPMTFATCNQKMKKHFWVK